MPDQTRPSLLTWAAASAAMLLLTMAAGCQHREATPKAEGKSDAAEAAVELGDNDYWEVYYLHGSKIGHGHTTIRRLERDGRPLVETTTDTRLNVARFGQNVEQRLKLSSLDTPAGEVVEFVTEITMGQAPSKLTGRVAGDRMDLEAESDGKRLKSQMAWGPGIRGFYGVEQSLAAAPPKPGERRKLQVLVPMIDQVAKVAITAGELETTDVLGKSTSLLRVESVSTLPDGTKMPETYWLDDAGRAIKRRVDSMQQESYRTTAAIAQSAAPAGPSYDVGEDTMVKVDPPLARPHQTQRVVYRVQLANGDPAQSFPEGPTQSVKSIDPHTAEITVTSRRPHDAPGEAAAAPAAEYLAANGVLQIDDPEIRRLAAEARGGETDPVQVALALERFVRKTVALKDMTQAFATAAEVARSRQGDCTEHAVLLAALARACGLPSRVAIGLVYVERSASFGFHMWTEVFINGQWTALDGTLGQGGIAAAHLKLNDSSLDGATTYSAFLPVAQVVGQLKIDVVEAE